MAEGLNQNFTFQPILKRSVESLIEETALSIEEKNASYSDMITEVEEDEKVGAPTILIKVQTLSDGTFYYWTLEKFYERVEMMKSSYMQFLEDGEAPLKVKENT